MNLTTCDITCLTLLSVTLSPPLPHLIAHRRDPLSFVRDHPQLRQFRDRPSVHQRPPPPPTARPWQVASRSCRAHGPPNYVCWCPPRLALLLPPPSPGGGSPRARHLTALGCPCQAKPSRSPPPPPPRPWPSRPAGRARAPTASAGCQARPCPPPPRLLPQPGRRQRNRKQQ